MIILYPEVEKFIYTLDRGTFAKTHRIIELLEDYQHRLSMPYSKILDHNLYELRVSGRPAVRIIYTFQGSNILLFYGFLKKSQQIPKKELRTIYQKFLHTT